MQKILDSDGDDRSIGLTYTKKFEPGLVGYPGSMSSSSGAVPVRVLSGLPERLWSEDMKYKNRVQRVARNNPDSSITNDIAK